MLKKEFLKSKSAAKVTFSLPKEAIEGAKEVRLLGEFNDWNWEEAPVMRATKKTYSTSLVLNTGKNYQFRYLADNGVWENDWKADGYTPAPFNVDNSVVTLPKKSSGTAKADTTTKPKRAASKKATATKADDLKKIEGIGPKIAGLLKEAGIVTFNDLAKAPQKILKKVLADAGSRFRMHDPKTWSAQAKLAAKGEWDKLKKWQGELKGGK